MQFSWGPYYSTIHTLRTGTTHSQEFPQPEQIRYVTAEDPQADLYQFDTSETLTLNPREHKAGVDLVLYKGGKGVISGKVTGTRTVFDPANADETTRPLEERYQSKEVFPLPGMEIRLQAKQNHYRGAHAPILLEQFATTDESGITSLRIFLHSAVMSNWSPFQKHITEAISSLFPSNLNR